MSKLHDKLTDKDIKVLADFFYLLWQVDERLKREAKRKRKTNGKTKGVQRII